jgi:MFS family permease
MSDHEPIPYTPPPAPDPFARPPRSRGSALLLAAAAALAAAIAGGIVWGLVVKWSDYEVGILAWAIGFAVGSAVLVAASRRKGPELQAIAIVGALVGILLGKYLSFAFAVQDEAERLGIEIGLLSRDMVDIFRDSLSDVFGGFDLLWIGLAVVSAWRLLRPDPPAEPLPPQPQPPPA